MGIFVYAVRSEANGPSRTVCICCTRLAARLSSDQQASVVRWSPALHIHARSGCACISPTTSVISSVGPILASTDGPSRHWPEPPPPYTPNKQSPLPSPWAQVEQAAESGVHFNDLLGLKEPSTWGSLLNFSGAGFGASGSQQKPTEIHHHQHTHQHTHVLQVINKHHYGSPDSLHYDAPPAPFSSVVRKAATPEIKRPTHLTPHSAPVVHKMPFSYRDVAARKEVHSNGHSPTQIIRKATPSGELETKLEPARSTESIPAETEAIRNGNHSEDTKTKADQEFQKISRKKGAKEKRAMSDSSAPVPVKELQKPKMDLPTRYQVLEKLSSPKIVKTDSVDSDDAVFAAKAEKIEKIDDPDHSPPRAKKNIIPERKKSSQPPSSKKRAPRKRNESDSWILRFIWNYICLFVEGLQDGLKWLMVLVVDVCSRSGELFLFAMQSVYECFMDFLHGIGQYVLGCVLSVFYTCRQLSLRQMFLSQPTDAVWGLDENMALPTTTEEALERLLRVRRVDAYAILGLRSDCTEDEILRHHARLQTLLNVEKTPMEGMEEAENLVETAFALIQTPDMREDYNHHNFGKNSLHNDLLDFWDTLRMKIEESRHTMLCDCGKRHARIPTPIKVNEARYCKRCGIKHPARLNDLWCETRLIGLAYLYYTCSDGVIYDISEWASCECQTSFLKHMKPNAHVVQYRLVSPGNLHMDRNTQALQDFLEDNSWATNSDPKNIRAKAQAYRPMEPRDEDRSRRAANRRQKRR